MLIIKNEIIEDLISTAMEGGSNYWCSAARPVVDGKRDESGDSWVRHDSGCINWLQTIKRSGIYLCDAEDYEEVEETDWHLLTRNMIKDGLKILSEKYPKVAKRIRTENWDADDADAFLQVCLFGEEVYG